jgi:hypothetical protein
MELNFGRHGVIVALSTLLFAVACGTASQSQPRARSEAGSGSQTDDSVVATIGGRAITLSEVDERARATNMSVFQELYNARRDALGELVATMLLSEEAASRGLPEDELIAEEVTARIVPVTDADVQAFYEENRGRLGGQTIEQIGAQIREYMVGRNEAQARQAFIDGLRADADVSIRLEPPRVSVTVARNERIKGPADAEITIVEYSDFQ